MVSRDAQRWEKVQQQPAQPGPGCNLHLLDRGHRDHRIFRKSLITSDKPVLKVRTVSISFAICDRRQLPAPPGVPTVGAEQAIWRRKDPLIARLLS
jgi:hypothetical protein